MFTETKRSLILLCDSTAGRSVPPEKGPAVAPRGAWCAGHSGVTLAMARHIGFKHASNCILRGLVVEERRLCRRTLSNFVFTLRRRRRRCCCCRVNNGRVSLLLETKSLSLFFLVAVLSNAAFTTVAIAGACSRVGAHNCSNVRCLPKPCHNISVALRRKELDG